MTHSPSRHDNVVPILRRPDPLAALAKRNPQLREALAALVLIEQAKGAISARLDTTTDVAFEMMRGLAESQHRDLNQYAAEIVENGGRLSPGEVGSRAAARRRGGPQDSAG